MSQPKACSRCGAPLAADVPGGLCLRCLLEFGLKSSPSSDPDWGRDSPGDEEDFPGYQVLAKVGEGGCGIVYRAVQLKPFKREVAIKAIKLGMDTKLVMTRFEAERQALALMDHPCIARIFDAGVTRQGKPFFVMELVNGERITDYCNKRNLSILQRLKLFLQVCWAVQHAHQKGIIHRDLKPSNILVMEQEGKPAPKVIDFGIAKAIGQHRLADQTIYTAFEQFIGTPAYMSPEQAGLAGEDIDTRSDIYSLGVLLYEVLTRHPPFDLQLFRNAALDEVCRIIREEEPVIPSVCVARVAKAEMKSAVSHRTSSEFKTASLLKGDLDWLVMKALEKNRARRYDSAAALAADIERHLGHEPVLARPPSAWYLLQKTARRHRIAFGSAVLIAMALTGGITVSDWMYYLERQARQRAEARAYMSDMNLAASMVRARTGGIFGAVQLLKYWQSHQPALRQWEWYYLYGMSHQDILSIQADSNYLYSVAWSPDGRRLVTGGAEGTTKIWNATTGQLLASHRDHQEDVLCTAWSPNGQLIASAGKDATISLWNPASQKSWLLRGHTQAVNCLAWSPDSQKIASGSEDGSVIVWDPAAAKIVHTFQAGGHVYALSWTKDGRHLAASGDQGHMESWDMHTFSEAWSLPHNQEGTINAVAWSPDGHMLAMGGADNAVNFCDAETGTNLYSYFDNYDVISALAWNHDGTLLASATFGDGKIAIRSMKYEGKVIRDFRGHIGAVRCVSWQPNGRLLASAGADGAVRIWAPQKESTATIELAQPDQVPALAWSPDGQKLATSSRRTDAWIWDLKDLSAPMALQPGYVPWTWAVAWNTNGTKLASGGSDGLKVWDVSHPAELWHETNFSGEIRAIAWSPSGGRIAAVGATHQLNIWDALTGRRLKYLNLSQGFTGSLAWSPDGRELAAGMGRKILVYDADDFALPVVLAGHTDIIRALAWSPDGLKLASASEDNTARIWDAKNGKLLTTLFGHTAPVFSVTWSPDGKRIATGSWDCSVKIWDPSLGAQVCSLDEPGNISQMIYAVAWNPDGQKIACADIEGNISILDAAPGRLAAKATINQNELIANAHLKSKIVDYLKLYCEIVEPHATDNADALRRLAWIRATSPYTEIRDGRKAVMYAKEASTLVGGKNIGILCILAAAHAEAGEFDDAISCQQRALALASNPKTKLQIETQLRLYELHQPCRDDEW